MAKASSFRVDSNAVAAGEWVSPGEEYDDLEIKTRGFTDLYTDARAARMRRLAVGFGGDERKIPNVLQREVIVDCLIKHVTLDVRNLIGDDDKPVSFAAFCDMLRNPDYPDLFKAAVSAASMVGLVSKQDVADAVGNSEPPSALP